MQGEKKTKFPYGVEKLLQSGQQTRKTTTFKKNRNPYNTNLGKKTINHMK